MRLKSFYAKSMSEAMQMVRNSLGDDAVIVATREEKPHGTVHVTAAIDPGSEGPAFEIGTHSRKAPAPEKDDWLQYDNEDEESAIAEDITDALLRHNVPEHVMDNIISCATVVGLDDPGTALIASLEHLFDFRPLPSRVSKKPIMMVGMPGAGKTLAVAKLAARGVMDDLKVGVITTDSVRAGGVEQLQAFTNLLKTNLISIQKPGELPHALDDLKGYDQVIIDTPGINPFEKEDIRLLAKLISVIDVDPYFVLPGGCDSEEAGEMARAFASVGTHTMIATRLDIARRLGSLLAAAHNGSMAFSDISNTPKVAGGLTPMSPKKLAKLFMPDAYRHNITRKTGNR